MQKVVTFLSTKKSAHLVLYVLKNLRNPCQTYNQCSRRGNRDDLGIIIHISPLKHILRSLFETVLMRGHNMRSC